MSQFGLQCVNNGQFIQIDSTFRNLVLAQQGTVSFGLNIDSFVVAQQVTYTGTANSTPIIFTAAPTQPPTANGGGNAVCPLVTISGTTYTFNLQIDGEGAESTINYYIFDVPPDANPTGAGLACFNAAGQCVFDSNQTYLKIAGVLAVPLLSTDPTDGDTVQPDGNTNFVSITMPSGSYATAVMSPQQCFTATPAGHGTAHVLDWRTAASVTTTTVSSALSTPRRFGAGISSPPTDFVGTATTVLIADVSSL